MRCRECGYVMDDSDEVCPRCQAARPGRAVWTDDSAPSVVPPMSSPATTSADEPASVTEARLSLEGLQRQKREMMAEIAQILAQITQIRAQHQNMTGQGAAPVQFPGLFGMVLNGITNAASVMAQSQLDILVQPLEAEKLRLEAAVAEIDQVIPRVERLIMENS
jgi:hypothetical protein